MDQDISPPRGVSVRGVSVQHRAFDVVVIADVPCTYLLNIIWQNSVKKCNSNMLCARSASMENNETFLIKKLK